MIKEELWQAVLAQVQLNTSPANFATWFKDTKIISCEKGEVVISTPNSFAKEWLENKYGKTILKILRGLDKEVKKIRYIVEKTELKIFKSPPSSLSHIEHLEGQLEFEQFTTDKETNLNQKYVFENFIVGPFNELAQAAAWAVSKAPGVVYNPLFIYGEVGLGKTHLLQAIGNAIVKNFPKKKVKYVPAENFTAEVISSIKNHNIEKLKMKYRTIDVLILDDVHFLAGKEKTQEELFHTFNALYEKNKQIIFSSDCPPKAIPSMAERLRSRFEGGMVGDISYPDYETRIAILKNKSQEKKVSFPDEIMDYVAVNVQRNIRELEGALNKLVAYYKTNKQTPSLETTKSLLKSLLFSPSRAINSKKIIQTVAEFYDLKEKDILSASRKKEIVKPRQIAMFLLREKLKSSYPFIGRKFGNKDHTTILYSCEKIRKEICEENNENLINEINLIRQRIASG